MNKKNIYNILLIFFSLLFAFSLFQIIRIVSGYKKTQSEYQSVYDQVVSFSAESDDFDDIASPIDFDSGSPSLSVDFEALKSLNEDYVGWLEIPGTAINYPMVYYSDNDYYLRRTFLGNYSTAGSIFIDARAGYDFSNDHLVIYGHRMNDGTMFSDLKKFFDPDFCAENNKIHIYNENEILIYEIFAVREVKIDDSCYTFSFSSKEFYQSWLSQMKSLSTVNASLSPNFERPTITLSTCVLNNSTSRNIIQAQLIERIPSA